MNKWAIVLGVIIAVVLISVLALPYIYAGCLTESNPMIRNEYC